MHNLVVFEGNSKGNKKTGIINNALIIMFLTILSLRKEMTKEEGNFRFASLRISIISVSSCASVVNC